MPLRGSGLRLPQHPVLGIVHITTEMFSLEIGDRIVPSFFSKNGWKEYETLKDDWHNPDFALHWHRTDLEGNPVRAGQLDLPFSSRATAASPCRGSGSGHRIRKDGREAASPSAKRPGGGRGCVRGHAQPGETAAEGGAVPPDPARPQRHRKPLPPLRAAAGGHHRPNAAPSAPSQTERGVPLRPPPSRTRRTVPVHGPRPVAGRADMWEWLEQQAEHKSGKSGEQFLTGLRGKDDSPALLEEHLAWLAEAGFAAGCLHLSLNRALVAAVKEEG